MNDAANETAETIISQLGGTNRLRAMVGAHSFSATDGGVVFKIKARATNGAKAIRITLDPSDTYTVEFISISRLNVKTESATFIYADQLQSTIERATGLYLSI